MGDDQADDGETDEEYFVLQATDKEILSFVEEEEVVTTKEVAEHFDYHLQTARRRLKALAEDGKLKQKDAGKRLIWWLPRDTS